MHIGTSPSTFLNFCLPPPPFRFVFLFSWSSLVFELSWLIVVVSSVLRLISSSRLLTVVATSFASHFSNVMEFCDTWEIHSDMFSPLSVHALICALIFYLFIEIDERGMLCFVSMQHLMYPSLFWWNLSSASIAGNILVFLPLTSFFDMFADLTYLTISSLSLKCMKACVIGLAGHFILKF